REFGKIKMAMTVDQHSERSVPFGLIQRDGRAHHSLPRIEIKRRAAREFGAHTFARFNPSVEPDPAGFTFGTNAIAESIGEENPKRLQPIRRSGELITQYQQCRDIRMAGAFDQTIGFARECDALP